MCGLQGVKRYYRRASDYFTLHRLHILYIKTQCCWEACSVKDTVGSCSSVWMDPTVPVMAPFVDGSKCLVSSPECNCG